MRVLNFLIATLIITSVFSQWTDTGSNTTTNDNIGLGQDPGNYRLYVSGNTFQNGQINFRTTSYTGTNEQTHLHFPVSSDGFYFLTRQLSNDKMEVVMRFRDNTTGDYFKMWFDDYRGSSYDRYPFQVAGDRVLLAADGGNVGIGTSSPSSNLHISAGTSGDAILKLDADTDNNNESDNPEIQLLQDANAVKAFIALEGNPGAKSPNTKANSLLLGSEGSNLQAIHFIKGDEVKMTITENVGIGTTSPSYKLEVNGAIRSKEIKVEASPWPDYVFEPDYELKSLEETAEFIAANKHLPGIPSAKEIEANGVLLGEMNTLLLKKIEELTLHLIEQQKINQELIERVEKLESR